MNAAPKIIGSRILLLLLIGEGVIAVILAIGWTRPSESVWLLSVQDTIPTEFADSVIEYFAVRGVEIDGRSYGHGWMEMVVDSKDFEKAREIALLSPFRNSERILLAAPPSN